CERRQTVTPPLLGADSTAEQPGLLEDRDQRSVDRGERHGQRHGWEEWDGCRLDQAQVVKAVGESSLCQRHVLAEQGGERGQAAGATATSRTLSSNPPPSTK